jgi:hypothetical protein
MQFDVAIEDAQCRRTNRIYPLCCEKEKRTRGIRRLSPIPPVVSRDDLEYILAPSVSALEGSSMVPIIWGVGRERQLAEEGRASGRR